MKSNRKIIAVIVAVVLLLGTFLIARATPYISLAGTHWYADSFACEYVSYEDLPRWGRKLVDLAGYVVKFVPDQKDLYDFNACTLHCGIDFHANGTLTITTGTSYFGILDPRSCSTGTGTWTIRNHSLIITLDGFPLPLTYENGVITMTYYGFGLRFVQA